MESSSFEEVAEATEVEDMNWLLGNGLDLPPSIVHVPTYALSAFSLGAAKEAIPLDHLSQLQYPSHLGLPSVLEKVQLQGELRSLLARGAQSRLEVSEEVLSEALSQMRDDLARGDVCKKRDLLRRFVDRIEAEKKRARLWYTFPLATGSINRCPQRNSNPRYHLERVVS